MPPDLAAVIVTYNSAQVVGNLLDSLPAALDGLSADVIVVDNGSTDDTVDVLLARGDCRIVRSANIGYAGGINLGVRQSPDAPVILVLNPDVILHAKSVPPLLAALSRPGAGIVAPQVRSEHGRLELSLRREPTLLRALGLTKTKLPVFSEYIAEPAAYRSPRPVDWATGAVLAMSRDCFDALGGWDESYFLYSEEVDASLRARDAGLATWYEPQAVATHIGGQSGRSDTTHSMQIVNRVRLYRRRHGSFASWCYYALTVANELSRIPRGHAESRTSVLALLSPARRPSCLRCSDSLVPR
ncbi:MAG TPA: glycosyltransferase family 2 protein [Streptosporangiaceae bacterium]|nr:glycosyltransferase family 2 protein [Streptosporangiaceae bacterium]